MIKKLEFFVYLFNGKNVITNVVSPIYKNMRVKRCDDGFFYDFISNLNGRVFLGKYGKKHLGTKTIINDYKPE